MPRPDVHVFGGVRFPPPFRSYFRIRRPVFDTTRRGGNKDNFLCQRSGSQACFTTEFTECRIMIYPARHIKLLKKRARCKLQASILIYKDIYRFTRQTVEN